MQSPDSELGKCAIAPHPADYDPRESALFADLQTEIDKLASLHAASSTDWSKVGQLATRYLREEAKDLTVAVWLAAAWIYTSGGAGASAAGQVLNDLVQDYWDELLPMRLRARRNQLTWLETLVERFMSTDQALDPMSEDAYAALLQHWRDVDSTWRSLDDEAPSFASFSLRLAQWPVAAAQEVEPTQEEPAAVVAVAAAAPVATPAPVAKPAQPVATAAPITMNVGTEWDSANALERALDQAMDALGGALEAGVRDFPENALWYRLSRARVWAALENAPSAQQGETRIPGPNDRIRERLAQLSAGSDNAALLAFAESQLITSRFWLDLNFASFTALSNLPAGQAAAAAIAQETAGLLMRIPTLAKLSFVDGTPFADERTQEWLSRHALGAGQPAAQPIAQPVTVSRAAPRAATPVAGLLSLSAAIAAATAQTESAQTLLNAALSRLHDSALQVASHAFTEHQSS